MPLLCCACRVDPVKSFVGVVISWHLDDQMRKPDVRRSAVPVLDTNRDIDIFARFYLEGVLVSRLVVTAIVHPDQNLADTLMGVMDVPVVAIAQPLGLNIERNMSNDCDDLLFCHADALGIFQMIFQERVSYAGGHQSHCG